MDEEPKFYRAPSGLGDDHLVGAVLERHLGVERLLEMIISERVPNPQGLFGDDTVLGFAAKLRIARALIPNEFNNPLWEAARALNNFRNQLVHVKSEKEQEKAWKKLVDHGLNFHKKTGPPLGMAAEVATALQNGLIKSFIPDYWEAGDPGNIA